MNVEKKYSKPEIEFVEFNYKDVILSSGDEVEDEGITSEELDPLSEEVDDYTNP